MSDACTRLRAVSYNVHECVGTDGVCDPGRIARVLRRLDAVVVGLQEVASRPGTGSPAQQLEYLAGLTGTSPVYGPTLRRRGGEYGNGILTRWPVRRVRRHDLSVPGFEPRGALEALLLVGEEPLRVVVTHLGLDRRERARQAQALAAVIRRGGEPTVVLGDLNEWRPFGRALRLVRRKRGRPPAPRSFPSRYPLFALDQIWAIPPGLVERVWADRSPLARSASDHLPVVGELTLGGGEKG